MSAKVDASVPCKGESPWEHPAMGRAKHPARSQGTLARQYPVAGLRTYSMIVLRCDGAGFVCNGKRGGRRW